MKNNRFTLRLSDRQLEILKEVAKKEKRTAAAIIRNFLDELRLNDKDVKQHNSLLNKNSNCVIPTYRCDHCADTGCEYCKKTQAGEGI